MKKTKIFICALLIVGMIVSAGILSANAASDVSKYDGTYDTSWYNAGSTSFTINNAAKFAGFVKLVNSGTNFSGKTVKLSTDIIWSDESADTWSSEFAPTNTWTPIGYSSSRSFRGTFDGQGHTISGLYYYSNKDSYAGLFGFACGATIKNVRITNSFIDAFNQVGSIVGRADESLTVQNCYSDAYLFSNNPTPTNHYVGGIVGYCRPTSAASSITGCVFKGKVISENGCDIAGILGRCEGTYQTTITECIVKANFVGFNRVAGILARAESSASIQNCYTDCNYYIFGTPNYGGILGGCRKEGAEILIKNCFYTGTVYFREHPSVGRFSNSLALRVGSAEYNGEKLTAAQFAEKTPDEKTTYAYITDTDGNSFYGKKLGEYKSGITFYTDKSDDTSNSAVGDQRGGIGTATVSTKENFVNNVASLYFGINEYGDVYLKRYALSHTDHCYGEWVADENGQWRQCIIGNCTNIERRDLNIKVEGAQVRFEAPTGMRFGTTIKKNDAYKALYGDGKYVYSATGKVTFGTLIVPSYILGENELTVNTKSVADVPAKAIYEENENEIVYTGVIIGVPETYKAYRMDLTARSYIKVTEPGQEPVYYYSDPIERSFYDVGDAAYDAQTDEVKAGLNMLVGLGCIDDDFYEENAQNVKILENATPEQFEEYKGLLEANGFTKYSENTIADNLFATYTNSRYIVYVYYTPRTIGKYTQNGIDGDYGDKVRNLVENQPNAPYHIGQSMTEMQKYITVEDVDNVMRVIVERKSMVDLPALQKDNIYVRNPAITPAIIEIKPNDILGHYGMGYIIRLADGSFLMIDGGENVQEVDAESGDPYDCDNVYNRLKELSGGKEPVIAAWILTHSHNDHVDMFEAFVKKYGTTVTIEQVICNFGGGLLGFETERGYVNAYLQHRVKQYSPNTKLIKAHTGQKFYVRNAEMTLLFTMDDFSENDVSQWVNNESLAFEVVMDGNQKIMFTGEVFIPGSRALIRMYGDSGELESDIIQLAHHGHFGATKELYEYIMPTNSTRETEKFILWPCGNYRQVWNTTKGYYNNDFGNRFGLAENAYILNIAKANNYHVYFYYDIGDDPLTEETYTYKKSRYYNPGKTEIKGGTMTIIPLSSANGDDNLGLWDDNWD